MKKPHQEWIEMIETCVNDYLEEYYMAPTLQEIVDRTGLSRSAVSRYLIYMREEGILDYNGYRKITTEKMKKSRGERVSVPVLGSISCGTPMFAEENIEEYVQLPVSLFGRGEFFILRAHGDSMIGAGINDGDLVLIRKQETAEPGQIVAALMGDETTLKRFYPDPVGRQVRLHPENSQYKDIYTKDCIVQGIAVKVVKDLV